MKRNLFVVSLLLSVATILPIHFRNSPLPASAQGGATPVGTKWALLVGINRYDDERISELKYSVADIGEVGGFLESQGWKVFLMTDQERGDNRPTHTNVFFRLDRLAQQIGPNDTFLFYFSGHGINREGHNYLLTVNSDSRTVENLQVSSVPLELLTGKMTKVRASQLVFILDACRNDPEQGRGDKDNPLTEGFVKGVQVVVGSQSPAGGPRGVAVLYACDVGERAYEWKAQQHGVFSYFLLDGLRGKAADANGEVTANNLADYVQKGVTEWSRDNLPEGKKQTPWLDQSGAGRLVLARVQPQSPTEPPEPPKPIETKATLTLNSLPSGAKVFVDDVERGVTPVTLTFDLGAQKQTTVDLIVQATGYESKGESLTLKRGQKVDRAFNLPRLPEPEKPKLPTTQPPTIGTDIEFVRIPAGDGVAAFEMGKYEVTVAQFRKFVEATGYKTTAEKQGWSYGDKGDKGDWDQIKGLNWRYGSRLSDSAQDNHPVVHVTADDAKAFCQWAGGRLPTDAEWEHAARGGLQGKAYVWGDAWPPPKGAGNFGDVTAKRKYTDWTIIDGYDDGNADSAPVGSFNPNGYGLYDMAGNVWELIGDRQNGCRGGSFRDGYGYADDLRVGCRGVCGFGDARGLVGLRAARTLR